MKTHQRNNKRWATTRLLFLSLLFTSLAAGADWVQWRVEDGGNGHFYEAVFVMEGISWTDANSEAQARAPGAHLATITSAAENEFVFDLIDDPKFWIISGENSIGPWLGGYQTTKDDEPEGGWEWVTGEAFEFTNWESGQPNDLSGIQDFLTYFTNIPPERGPTWDDDTSEGLPNNGYIIEVASVPTTGQSIVQATYERANIGFGAIDSVLKVSFISGPGFIQRTAFTLPNGSFDLGSALIFDATSWTGLNLGNVSKEFEDLQNGSAQTVVFNFTPGSFEAGDEVLIFLDIDGDRGPGTQFFVELFDGRSADGVLGGLPDPGPSSVTVILEPKINVEIDIKPGNKQNVLNPRAQGGIWVAVLSNTSPHSPFDPSSQVDIPTVEFGPDGAKAIRHKVKDINKDGLGDLLLRFKIPATGIACGDTEATLTGETFGGLSISGTDSIKTVGCTPKKCHKMKHHKKHHHGHHDKGYHNKHHDDDHKKR